MTSSFSTLFASYRQKIDQAIELALPSLGPKNPLSEACAYALSSDGKRFRPAIVLMLAEALNQGTPVMDSALAVEFFHTASLIADDLPCMDNDSLRRGRPSLHKAYNETIALLASYALISAGYEQIRLNAAHLPAEKQGTILSLALENATFNTGALGATGGQLLDLYPPATSESTILELMAKKTGTLFEISFVFGWLFGGGEITKLPTVKETAQNFGVIFQVIDDFSDLEEDRSADRMNYPKFVGEERARSFLEQKFRELFEGIEQLALKGSAIEQLALLLKERAAQCYS